MGGGKTFEDTESLQRRKRRFEPYPTHSNSTSSSSSPPFHSHTNHNGYAQDSNPTSTLQDRLLLPENQAIVGTCQKLDKPYLRLTGIPNPSTIRPLDVLRKALDWILEKWRSEENYGFACEQLKSVRQDLMVQRIREPFTVRVYENHARIALEKKDLGEYNQCQSQLKFLYRIGITKGAHPMEFKAYKILYLLLTRNKTELNSEISSLTPEDRNDAGIAHALQVQRAISLNNYKKLFELYAINPPRMGGYIMDHFVTRERVYALITICKSYPVLALDYVQRLLAFESIEQLTTFLEERHALIYKTQPTPLGGGGESWGTLDCKMAYGVLVEAAKEFRKVDLKGQI
ncbi:hypothetical protein BT69DRAFT_880670 [Atractiella rhizophila]|nr:hypothetical protein BT69DRAFT_880670 [Atractiella rhizophila]